LHFASNRTPESAAKSSAIRSTEGVDSSGESVSTILPPFERRELRDQFSAAVESNGAAVKTS
jgi:hypothetical protein